MILNFPDTPTDGFEWVDPNGITWRYTASDDRWDPVGTAFTGYLLEPPIKQIGDTVSIDLNTINPV